MILYEYRPCLSRSRMPILLSRDKLGGLDGFVSIWGYPEDTVEYIKTQKSLKGLKNRLLYTDCVYLDFDDKPAEYQQAVYTLHQLGAYYESFETGNRGYHIHIRINPTFSYYLPARIYHWVSTTFPGADLSIYKPSGIIRLPNTIHLKTGRKKVLLHSVSGKELNIPDTGPPIPKIKIKDENQTGQANNLAFLLADYPTEGGRNNHCFRLLINLWELKVSRDTAVKIVLEWNQSLAEQLGWQEIQQVVRSVYGGGY